MNPSTVSRWEEGASAPDTATLHRVAAHLDVRPEYFLRPAYHDGSPMFLRSLSSTYVRDLDYQRSQMRWLQEISHTVEHYVDLPEPNIPNVLDGYSYHQLRDDDLERIALDLRRYWRVEEGPAPDMVGLMERVGFVVGVIEMGTIKLDGLCSWSPVDGRPHVLLATDKMSFPRRQMDAAHEMAHAILHRAVSPDEFKKNLPFIEKQAFRLGSAFLMPATTYPIEIRSASLANLLTAKERWRVAVKAQIKRLADLKVITPDVSTHLYKLYSAKGWTRGEPLDQHWKPAEPRALHDAMHIIVNEGVRSKADLLAVEFTMSAGDVENLAALPAGWFSRAPASVVKLKPPERSAAGLAGTVVPFPTTKR